MNSLPKPKGAGASKKPFPFTQEYVRSVLIYDPETGIFTNRVWRGGSAITGKVTGTRHWKGYIQMVIKGRAIWAHRLAWFYMHGTWPAEIDHRDRQKDNNRIANLRIALPGQNNQNRGVPKNCKSGVTGVSLRGERWSAVIMLNKKRVSLGTFATKDEAARARREAESKIHPFFEVNP